MQMVSCRFQAESLVTMVIMLYMQSPFWTQFNYLLSWLFYQSLIPDISRYDNSRLYLKCVRLLLIWIIELCLSKICLKTGFEISYKFQRSFGPLILKNLGPSFFRARFVFSETFRRVHHIGTHHAFRVESIVTYHGIYRKRCIT